MMAFNRRLTHNTIIDSAALSAALTRDSANPTVYVCVNNLPMQLSEQ